MKTFYLYAVAFDNNKIEPDAPVFTNKHEATLFAFNEVFYNNFSSAVIFALDGIYIFPVANVNKSASVADYFYLTGKLPGGYIKKAA